MTVGEMRTSMSHAEYVGWRAFHKKRAQEADLEEQKAKQRRR